MLYKLYKLLSRKEETSTGIIKMKQREVLGTQQTKNANRRSLRFIKLPVLEDVTWKTNLRYFLGTEITFNYSTSSYSQCWRHWEKNNAYYLYVFFI